jgi:hypothetical protein
MSRRTDLLNELLQSNKFGEEKKTEQKMLMTTAELILSDFLDIALNGVQKHGPGSLVINLQNDTTIFMRPNYIEEDIQIAERYEDKDVLDFLKDLMQRINENDWSKTVLLTIISDAGTRTFAVETGGGQESFRALAEELSG